MSLSLLDEISKAKAIHYYNLWRSDRDESHLIEAKEQIEQIKLGKIKESVLTISAIYEVVVSKNLNKAKQLMDSMPRETKMGIWNCNAAFIDAAKGNIASAIKRYRKATEYNDTADMEKIEEFESFLGWYADRVDAAYCHFLLGLLNEMIKGDSDRARFDYEAYVRSNHNNEAALTYSRKYLVKAVADTDIEPA